MTLLICDDLVNSHFGLQSMMPAQKQVLVAEMELKPGFATRPKLTKEVANTASIKNFGFKNDVLFMQCMIL